MKDEILEGIKTAIEHGSSLDSAVQSFINAGYNPAEVREAAKELSSGASAIVSSSQSSYSPSKSLPPLPKLPSVQKKESSPQVSEDSQTPQVRPLPSSFPRPQIQKKNGPDSKKMILVIVLVVVLIILLGLLGLVLLKGDDLVSKFLS